MPRICHLYNLIEAAIRLYTYVYIVYAEFCIDMG